VPPRIKIKKADINPLTGAIIVQYEFDGTSLGQAAFPDFATEEQIDETLERLYAQEQKQKDPVHQQKVRDLLVKLRGKEKE